MASVTVHRVAGPLSGGRPLTSAGGLVQSGGYMNMRMIDIKSRRFPQEPVRPTAIGGKGPALPKGMD